MWSTNMNTISFTTLNKVLDTRHVVHKSEYNKLYYCFNPKSFPLSQCPLLQKSGPPLKTTKAV